jgi:hypothetical protein
MAPEAVPEVTAVPFTVTVACDSLTVGVTVILEVALLTEAVYAVVALAKVGDSVPDEIVKPDKVASVEETEPPILTVRESALAPLPQVQV